MLRKNDEKNQLVNLESNLDEVLKQANSEAATSLAGLTLNGVFAKPSALPSMSLDFKAQGVGGSKKEIERILRDFFFSRGLEELGEAYGTQHKKGMLLFGVPGVGKTLIARTVAARFAADRVKVVNGPELLNRFVGQSEENVRELFSEALFDWDLLGKSSGLRVIIFDEFDALCPVRGAHTGGTGVDDKVVNTLLTMIDGIKSSNNVLIIATTNRKDMIDPAMLRAGRLDTWIEIGLPDETGRLEILEIHTKIMRENKLLDGNVNLKMWAKRLENYTGAEIEQLIIKAKNIASAENFDLTGAELRRKENIKDITQLAKVTQAHFEQAVVEMMPAFGANKQRFNFDSRKFSLYDTDIVSLIEKFRLSLNLFKKGKGSKFQWLISGEHGAGKLFLAKYFAHDARVNYVRVLSAADLQGKMVWQQLKVINELFADVERMPFSVVILDKLEDLLNADAECQVYNNEIRLCLEQHLKAEGISHKRIVIATTRQLAFIQKLHLHRFFNDIQTITPLILERHSKRSAYSIALIAFALGYVIKVPVFFPPKSMNQSVMGMPIADLVHQIHQFASRKDKGQSLEVEQFYDFLKASLPQSAPVPTSGPLYRH